MVKVAGFFAMSVGAFIFWQTMDKIHVWNALRQDEKDGATLVIEVLKDEKHVMQERFEKEMEIKRVREELLRQAKDKDDLA
ncbi:hypothetical protein POTOM_050609 [Populus tomentosa]|uniref:Uncharacterized protein n=1 Tax=Populus tomentosa TaxID=118781 RepID=A0A8X7Y7Z2_POPTO|nr:hypothetical protein POTOM_050609 [Populus tomentosa]